MSSITDPEQTVAMSLLPASDVAYDDMAKVYVVSAVNAAPAYMAS